MIHMRDMKNVCNEEPPETFKCAVDTALAFGMMIICLTIIFLA